MLKKPEVNGNPEIAREAHSSVMAVIAHVLAQAAHLPQILLAVQPVDHRARAEEQQRFEERVRHQMEDAGRESARRPRLETCSRAARRWSRRKLF